MVIRDYKLLGAIVTMLREGGVSNIVIVSSRPGREVSETLGTSVQCEIIEDADRLWRSRRGRARIMQAIDTNRACLICSTTPHHLIANHCRVISFDPSDDEVANNAASHTNNH